MTLTRLLLDGLDQKVKEEKSLDKLSSAVI